jgi:hypothetical protein
MNLAEMISACDVRDTADRLMLADVLQDSDDPKYNSFDVKLLRSNIEIEKCHQNYFWFSERQPNETSKDNRYTDLYLSLLPHETKHYQEKIRLYLVASRIKYHCQAITTNQYGNFRDLRTAIDSISGDSEYSMGYSVYSEKLGPTSFLTEKQIDTHVIRFAGLTLVEFHRTWEIYKPAKGRAYETQESWFASYSSHINRVVETLGFAVRNYQELDE